MVVAVAAVGPFEQQLEDALGGSEQIAYLYPSRSAGTCGMPCFTAWKIASSSQESSREPQTLMIWSAVLRTRGPTTFFCVSVASFNSALR
jgi:hypothetical protein